MLLNDTIIAVASPPGRAPRGIVRISGPAAVDTVQSRFSVSLETVRGFTAVEGAFRLTACASVPIRLYLFRAPRSYTGEPLCELHTPASPPLLDWILESLMADGARLAEPGEFTRRAFLNGRLQLNQVEAVAQVIHAQNEADLKQSVQQLSGPVAGEIVALREALVHITSRLELDIDFSDQDVQIVSSAETVQAIDQTTEQIAHLLTTQSSRALPEDGITVVIVGPTNAGKSTLFNRLSETKTVLVSDQPGTTRDRLTGFVKIDGIPFHLIDTPGLRPVDGLIEQQAQQAAQSAQKQAVIELRLLDGTDPVPADIDPPAGSVPQITAINKCDLPQAGMHPKAAIGLSAKTGAGIDHLRAALVNAVRRQAIPAIGHGFVPNQRHRQALEAARAALANARASASDQMSPEFTAVDLRAAIGHLKEITGEVTTDQLLETIFADFCIGK